MEKDKVNTSDSGSSLYNSLKANALASKVVNIDKFLPRRYTTYTEPLKDDSTSKSDPKVADHVMDQASVKQSFASALHDKPVKKFVNIKEMRSESKVNDATVTLPIEAVEAVNARFTNTLYGYFIDNRLAFPLVENYVKHTWAKYGLKRIQMHEEFLLFQFNTREGMESVLENGPWLIRLMPLILNEWTPNTILKKDEIKSALVWVKMHHVPIEGHTLATIDIEYEWTPLRCETCLIFYHVGEKCPKLPKVIQTPKASDDGFTEKGETSNHKTPATNLEGNKEGSGPIVKKATVQITTTSSPLEPTINTTNSFSALFEDDYRAWDDDNSNMIKNSVLNVINESDSEDEEVNEYITMNEMKDQNQRASNPLEVCAILESRVADHNLARMCDFNSSLFAGDSTAGSSVLDIAMREFKECVENMEVMDGILKKLDRVMANLEFHDVFVGAHAIFRPYHIPDHSPSVLAFPTLVQPLRKLMYDKGNLHDNVNRLRGELDRLQSDLDNDPSNVRLREEEAATVCDFNDALIMEEWFLKQKAKIEWLNEGDSNSAYFHKANEDVAKAFISHYEIFLGQHGTTHGFNTTNLFGTCLSANEAANMVRYVSNQEIKSEMFSMGNDKSPGPDGFTAIELNHTVIALIPKVNAPARVNDYRPISCCNVLFKCISKIIANRIKDCLNRLVSLNQSAFVSGQSITDNILLTQEIMHNYHLDHGASRCTFKVDIQKAYDTVDWEFLRADLVGFGFHPRMVAWIMECVSTTSFLININGSLHGYFKGTRGLRQGDSLSPYFFTLIMEVLTLMLHRRARELQNFTYHRYRSKLDLINLCFTDDLFLFAHGDVNSVMVIKEALEEFKDASGLTLSMPKSTVYFCNILNHIKLAILHILPFEEGRLLVNDWKNKSLSVAGRLQLIQSVMSSMHIYWASVFILLTRVLLDIEQIMCGFLWCQGSMRKGKAKVSWEVVCLPMKEGGLSVRRLDVFNNALMVSHIWKLLSLKESLWVR
nr:hypothetical protein [Tanacetum cinerariifolium]GEW50942.1 hypothetical protein [Tanacetum cinerariifolium]